MTAKNPFLRKKKRQFMATNTTTGISFRAPLNFAEISSQLNEAGWGRDKLTQEIEGAFCNIGVSFLNLKPYFELLIKATEIFSDASELLSWSTLDGLIACSLFGRAAGCFLGAVRLSCSGQLTETWVLLRACLENSLYAFYIFKNPKRAEIWIDRHKDEGSKQKCKETFLIRNIWDELKAKSPSIAREMKDFYNKSIDWGAHPNERSLSPNLVGKQDGSGFQLRIVNPDPEFMRATVIATLITSSVVFRVFSLVFPDMLSHPNLNVKIQNLNQQSKPLMFEVARQLRKLTKHK